MRLERVARVQKEADGRVVGLPLPFPERVEQRLHLVRRLAQLREPEGAAAALDGMGRAEDRVQDLRVAAVRAQRHGPLLDGLEVLLGLVEEGADETVEIDGHGVGSPG